MELDWVTVSAQVVNFLVLIGLLKRFLYGPIVDAMDRRERHIAERLDEAMAREREAEGEARRHRDALEKLEREPVEAVVSSPRRRAVDTATPIARRHDLEVEIVPDLRELDFGELEGRTYDEIADSLPELYATWMAHPTRVRFPGGEVHMHTVLARGWVIDSHEQDVTNASRVGRS